MKTLVIIGAGCSAGLAYLPTDYNFIADCEEEILKTRFLYEALVRLYCPSIMPDRGIKNQPWKSERLEICWNEIDENRCASKIILKTEDIDQWFQILIELARAETLEYKYYSHFLYTHSPFNSPYQYLFTFACWELQKIVVNRCNIKFTEVLREKYDKLVKKIRSISVGSNAYVSFNYDILLEKALKDYCYIGIPPCTSSVHCGEKIPILKPHGSINWLEISNRPNGIFDDLDVIPVEKVGYKNEVFYKHSIIGLVGNKESQTNQSGYFSQQFYNFGVLSDLEQLINEAEMMIIVGYGFPITDGHIVRTFVKSRPKALEKVVIVNKLDSQQEIDLLKDKASALLKINVSKIDLFLRGVENWI